MHLDLIANKWAHSHRSHRKSLALEAAWLVTLPLIVLLKPNVILVPHVIIAATLLGTTLLHAEFFSPSCTLLQQIKPLDQSMHQNQMPSKDVLYKP